MVNNNVVFVMGATATGKSKLAIDLAIKFNGEIINSDKIQIYKGLDIMTNKVTAEECQDIPHHLLSSVDSSDVFDAHTFRHLANYLVESIIARGKLPIIAGGSNSYIEELVEGNNKEFKSKYQCCFLWVDIYLPDHIAYVFHRVDKMVEMGLINEAKANFVPGRRDYAQGIQRAIGVPELDAYFRGETLSLEKAIEDMKINTCKLVLNQLEKIKRLHAVNGWNLHWIDATNALIKKKNAVDCGAWEVFVREPSLKIVMEFLIKKQLAY